MSRDKTIDRLRGFAMFWVIVVHVLYWGNFFTNEYVNLLKSFCLFEMPLFFFITGASNSFSKISGYFDFVSKRFQRILIPYWVFALICALLSICKFSIKGNMDFFSGMKILLSWMVPVNRQITSVSYLTLALWFIPVYLCVALIIPVLKRMRDSSRKIGLVFFLLGIFVVSCLLKMEWFQYVAFYSFWTYIGLFYRDIKAVVEQKHTRRYLLCLAAAGMAVICILYLAGQPIDMQSNKFPPNLVFLVFSITMMALIIFEMPYVDRVIGWFETGRITGKIVNLFSTRSMTIFLYQVFAFNLTTRLTNILIVGDSIIVSIVKSVFCLVASILICAGFAIIFGKIETLEIRHYGSKV